MQKMDRKQAISYLLEKGILVSPEEIEILKDISKEALDRFAAEKGQEIVFSPIMQAYKPGPKVVVENEYLGVPKKIIVKDFVDMFNSRYEAISGILKQRPELANVVSIKRAAESSNAKTAVIGMVFEKNVTKNNYIIMKLEDQTGVIDAVISPEKHDLYMIASDITEDEIIGVIGTTKQSTIFVNNIFFPDIPLGAKLKKSPENEYVAVLGDIHYGSRYFLRQEFEKFIEWINGNLGNEEQKSMARKVKYLVLTGDLVEGVGIYPSQEEDLDVVDIKMQYSGLADLLKKIPSHIIIIALPGNHDASRLQEPQPPIMKEFASALWEMPNMILVSNPCTIKLGATKDFEGFDMLLYHGYSLIHYAENVPSIRQAGGQKRPDLLMKHILQRRHLGPTHSSVTYIPGRPDPLIISSIPDFFITGHIHRVSVSNYRNITLINASCWGDVTEDQIKRGLLPQPGRVPVIDLNTRDVKVINFYKEKEISSTASRDI